MTQTKVYKDYAKKLIQCLPMDDVLFIAELSKYELLPGNTENTVKSFQTQSEKASYFLNHVIKPAIDIDDFSSFNNLLSVMKDCDYTHVKKLACEIQAENDKRNNIETDLQRPLSKKAKIDTAGMLNKVQTKLKKAYDCWCLSDNPHQYIQLALVRDEIHDIRNQKLNEITRHTLHGQVDEILKLKEPLKRGLEDIFHYNDLLCPRVILILGAPGIGKSTLANEICLKWAQDKGHFLSNDYDFVILIRLRTVQEKTLEQVIIEAVGSEAAYGELLTKSHGERCLIILEGLDEISADWQKDDMFCQLVKTTNFLSYANILVTSRPHACIHLYEYIKDHSRTIEIVGFDKPQIEEYAELYFKNSKTVKKFMEQINSDLYISSLCYVPLCLDMVLKSFKHNNENIHATLTELYQTFIISQVDKHIHLKKAMPLGIVSESDQHYIKNLTIVLNDIPNVLSKVALEILFLLSKLAYKSFFQWFDKTDPNSKSFFSSEKKNSKLIYTSKDLANCNITDSGSDACGLLRATNTLFACSNTAVYSFNHLSVQEYFCALYISLLPEDEQLQLHKDHITDYPHMWPFYAGITKLKLFNMLYDLSQLLLHDKQQLEDPTLISRNFGAPKYMDNIKVSVALNSLYEAQVSSNVCKDQLVSLLISVHNLRQYDYISIFYLMSIASITCLHLRSCNIGDRQAEELLARCRDLIPTLKVLDLFSNGITHKGVKSLIKIMKNTSLTHVSVAHNVLIGDAGIQLISLKHLVQLNIGGIFMTHVDSYILSEYFRVNNSLQSLEMNQNYLNSGLTGLLNNLPSTLVRLIISDCKLTYNGAVNIGDMLRVNEALKHLEISDNSIGDGGISVISDSLCVNKTLIQLVASNCEFHSKGAESIAKMLHEKNTALKYLDISKNQIKDDGTTAVALSVQHSTTLVLLNISGCGFCNQGANAIGEMLRRNKTLKCLDISKNYIKDDEMSALACSIQASTTIIKLKLSDTRHKAHEFMNEALRLKSVINYNDGSYCYSNAIFSREEMNFEEWFIYDSRDGPERSYCLPERHIDINSQWPY